MTSGGFILVPLSNKDALSLFSIRKLPFAEDLKGKIQSTVAVSLTLGGQIYTSYVPASSWLPQYPC